MWFNVDLPELTTITIGDYSFCDTTQEFTLSSMNICRIVILDLPKLETIKTGSDSFRELHEFSLSGIL